MWYIQFGTPIFLGRCVGPVVRQPAQHQKARGREKHETTAKHWQPPPRTRAARPENLGVDAWGPNFSFFFKLVPMESGAPRHQKAKEGKHTRNHR